MKKIVFSFLLCLFGVSILFSQSDKTPRTIHICTLADEIIQGDLINITTDSIFIYDEKHGSRAYSKANIKYFKEGAFKSHFTESVNSSVPYIVETAMPNGKGKNYYKNYYLFGNEFNYGISDHLNLSAGFEIASIIFGSGNVPVIALGAKYSIPLTSHFYAGLSTKFFFNDNGTVLLSSVPFTVGSKRSNLTLAPVRLAYDDTSEYGLFSNLSIAVGQSTRMILDLAFIDGETVPTILMEYTFKTGFTLSLGIITGDGDSIPNFAFSVPFGSWDKPSKKTLKF